MTDGVHPVPTTMNFSVTLFAATVGVTGAAVVAGEVVALGVSDERWAGVEDEELDGVVAVELFALLTMVVVVAPFFNVVVGPTAVVVVVARAVVVVASSPRASRSSAGGRPLFVTGGMSSGAMTASTLFRSTFSVVVVTFPSSAVIKT